MSEGNSILGMLRRLFRPESERSYEAAGAGRLHYGVGGPSTSANAEIVPQAGTLRDRSRELCRNNPTASRAVEVLSTAIVGARGIQPRWSTVADEGLRRDARQLWDDWSRKVDSTGQHSLKTCQYLAVRGMIESGSTLVRRRLGPLGSADVPLSLQLMEPDWLDPLSIGGATGGPRIIGGIVLDPTGRIIGYRMRLTHPGDSLALGSLSTAVETVSAAEIAHLYAPTRPGQLHGVPHLHAVMDTLTILGSYEAAELIRREAQATLAMVVRGSAPPTGRSVTEPGQADGMGLAVRDADGRTVETMEPGSIYYANGADSIEMTSPAGDATFHEVAKYYQRKAAAGSGVPYSQLTTDLSDVNYSAFRAGQLDFRAINHRIRDQSVLPHLMDPIWSWWRGTVAAAQGARFLALPASMTWTQPVWQSVEPQKDASATLARIQAGLSSLSGEIEDYGDDPEEVWAALASDRDRLAALGLRVVSIQA